MRLFPLIKKIYKGGGDTFGTHGINTNFFINTITLNLDKLLIFNDGIFTIVV